MASLLNLKRRIKTAQNVSKTTKAMQMIAASKLKKAQEAALTGRPYVEKLTEVANSITAKVDPEALNDYMKRLSKGNEKLVLVIAPDKGLSGALVTNLTRELVNFTKENKNVKYITVGKKALGSARISGGEILASFEITTTLPTYDLVYPVMKLIDNNFLSGKVAEVYVLYSDFQSVFSQVPKIKKILPVEFESQEKSSEALIEPAPSEILPGLIRHYLEINVFQAFLENYLSEQAARMLAMQNATENAQDIIEDLRLVYNKTRQEKITNEILDIAGGVFANA